MREYKFEVKKVDGMYEIRDAIVAQNLLVEMPIRVPLGALVSFYQKLAKFCYDECIMGNSIYGNQRDIPYVYAVLKDKECKREASMNYFEIGKSEDNGYDYDVWHLICDGPTTKYHFPRKALNVLCIELFKTLNACEDPKIKVWADYVLNKMAEDVELNYELFNKWIIYCHPDTPGCYYEVWFDAYDCIDEHLTLRQNVDIAAAYIKDHEHDYD